MKVILLEDVPKIGQKHDVKDVPQGHALNFLIPKKLAEPATKQGLKRLETVREQRVQEQEDTQQAFKAALAELGKGAVTFARAANESGHLYEGIKTTDIAEHLAKNNISIVPDCIVLDAPIKEVGEHTVTVALGELSGTFVLNVTSEASSTT
jgi:large subunit ribosomal protein L9